MARNPIGDMIRALADLDEDGLNEFDRALVESVNERTANGRVPGVLHESEVTKVEGLYAKHCA